MSQPQQYGHEKKNDQNQEANLETLKSELSEIASTIKQMALEQVETRTEDIKQSAVTTANDVEAYIRKNPTQAAIAAAGVGFLVGLILTR
jgi:ElaB/YqjD/DUF883 family membrane-anchored ribosome-binding protein